MKLTSYPQAPDDVSASSAIPTPHITYNNLTPTIFVLSFDASKWSHQEARSHLKNLSGDVIPGLTGTLGAFASMKKAQKIGEEWIVDSLAALGKEHQGRFPNETGYDHLSGEWQSDWKTNISEYIVRDDEKGIALSMIITEVKFDQDSDSDSQTTEDAYQELLASHEKEAEEGGTTEQTKSQEEAGLESEHEEVEDNSEQELEHEFDGMEIDD